MRILKNNWMPTIYSFVRLFSWSALYGMTILLPMFIILSPIMFGDKLGNLPELLEQNKPFMSQSHYMIMIFLIHAVNFITYKPALKKVFFKPYKRFDLVPNFSKVSWKFSLAFYGKIFLLTYLSYALIGFIFALIYEDAGNPAQFVIDSVTNGSSISGFMFKHVSYGVATFLSGIIIIVFALKSAIEKHANIVLKAYTSLTWKQAFYCFARYFLWRQLFLFSIIAVVTAIACFCSKNPIGFMAYFGAIIYISVGFLATKKSLNKVFFKEYKNFKLIPNIQKITFGLAAKTELLNLLCLVFISYITFLGSLSISATYKVNVILPAIAIGLMAFIFSRIVILKLSIERNTSTIIKNNQEVI